MTDPRSGLRAPADSGRVPNFPTDERVIRALWDEHRVHSHHENLCPVCLVTAARLGQPMPEGRWIEPCWRAKVYAKALHLLGAFSDGMLAEVLEAWDLTKDCERADGGYWFAANRLRAFLGAEYCCPTLSNFDAIAYRAICEAARPADQIALPGPDGFPHADGAPSEADLDAVAEEKRVADLTNGVPLRCAECKRLRHSTPRHEPTCSKAPHNCPACLGQSEPHLASCPRSVIDVPGVGCVPAYDCGGLL